MLGRSIVGTWATLSSLSLRAVRSIGTRAGLGVDAGSHADPRTTSIDDRCRRNFDRHAPSVVGAFVAGG